MIAMGRIGCLILLQTLACAPLLAPQRARGEMFAVVVGVNECPQFRLSDGAKPRPLRGAESDADALAALLVKHYGLAAENLHLLKGRDASRVGIRDAFQRVTRTAKAEDVFLFHFSGHGTQVADQRPWDEVDGLDEALCTFDCSEAPEHLLLDDQMSLWLDELPTRRITVVLDCCHAGTATKDTDAEVVPRFLPRRVESRPGKAEARWPELRGTTKDIGRQLTAFFACQPDQLAYERRLPGLPSTARAGQFSHYLLSGLREGAADANRDGAISNQELLEYVRGRLDESFNRQRPMGDRQQPLLETSSPQAPVFYLGATSER